MRVNADSLLIRAAATSTSGTLIDLTTDLIMANNNNNNEMSSINHLHAKAEVLNVKEHSQLLSAQYLVRCTEPKNVCHSITTRDPHKIRINETLFTRHRNTVEPVLIENNRKSTPHANHTDAVNNSVNSQESQSTTRKGI